MELYYYKFNLVQNFSFFSAAELHQTRLRVALVMRSLQVVFFYIQFGVNLPRSFLALLLAHYL